MQTSTHSPATRNRTRDHLMAANVYSQMLCQLSYSRYDTTSLLVAGMACDCLGVPHASAWAKAARSFQRHARVHKGSTWRSQRDKQQVIALESLVQHGPHRLVVRTSRCGRDNPGSTPGVVIKERTLRSEVTGCGEPGSRAKCKAFGQEGERQALKAQPKKVAQTARRVCGGSRTASAELRPIQTTRSPDHQSTLLFPGECHRAR